MYNGIRNNHLQTTNPLQDSLNGYSSYRAGIDLEGGY